MRSYDQYCGLAKALDVIGDRWTMLIVRELLLRERARYTDLQHGLPGIATNLLADRLRDLEAAGVVAREDAPPPVATTVFRLTEWGQQLRPIVLALGRWAAPLLEKPAPGDACRAHWLSLPLESMLRDRTPARPPVRIELRVTNGDPPMVLETVGGGVRVRPASKEPADVVLTGPPDAIIGVLAGRLTLAEARARRLRVEGRVSALQRLAPVPRT